MKLSYISVVVVVCVMIEIQCERTRSAMCKGCQQIYQNQEQQYTRIKRAKYYSSPPLKFYNRPPATYPIKGAFSFTPPPGYQMDDVRQAMNLRPKVSSHRPTSEGLGDEDINNIMKFLSKQDLDKIVEFANGKERESQKHNKDLLYGRPYIANRPEKYESKVMYENNSPELDIEDKYLRNRPFIDAHELYSIEHYSPNINEVKATKQLKSSDIEQSLLFNSINQNKMFLNTQFDSDSQNQQISNLNAYTYQEVQENRNGANIFSDSSLMQEEQLPKPSNLREDDGFEVSYTNNVPTVVKADSDSYKIENLGALPLMNYHSKLTSVDSYKVPHYTVTSSEKYGAPTPDAVSSANIPVEPAPPASTAQEQSDAHLKATKIWTHKSKGTAYTLHSDGTLSLEKSSRPKTNYGYS